MAGDMIGVLFKNKTKDGQVYLKGTVNDVKVVAFLTKEKVDANGELFFTVKKDTPLEKDSSSADSKSLKEDSIPF